MSGAVIEYDVPVPMRDGVVLRADVYRPAGEGPWPVIVARTPYDKTDASELLYIDPWAAVRRGFITVVQDVRGRFASEGGSDWRPLETEAEDGADTITWAAQLPGSNGNVGMWGLSYLGNVQWQAAAERPSALKAIVPQFTWHRADEGLGYRGGAKELGTVRGWGLGVGFDLVMRRHASDPEGMSKHLMELVGDLDDLQNRTFWELPTGSDPVLERHGLPSLARPEVLAASNVADRQEAVTVPSLNIGGWFDIFVQGTIDNYQAAARRGTPSKLVIGPWNHVSTLAQQGEVSFGFAGNGFAVDFETSISGLSFDWLHAWLTSDETPPQDDLPVKIFVMGANEWRSEAEWPLARAVDTSWFLGPEGSLTPGSEPAPDTATYTYDPADPVPTVGGATMLTFSPAGVFDQRPVEARPDVLVFTSEPLTEDLEVTGRVTATLTTATDGPTTDWIVRLCDVHPDGRSYNVADGITRVRTTPNEPATVTVDLWSTSMVFKQGHRIRVQVTSSCFPRWDRNLNTADGFESGSSRVAHQTVQLGGATASRITLPVVPPSS
ncbi:CocE/NonD family hydrolase [Streptomyces sp. NPDC057257]|uniref:CocE/NonD family hydrolase n=1 Tax=Streptomyces sp. NPDC057257 TaxID=3346071 RepID=UPI003637049A